VCTYTLFVTCYFFLSYRIHYEILTTTLWYPGFLAFCLTHSHNRVTGGCHHTRFRYPLSFPNISGFISVPWAASISYPRSNIKTYRPRGSFSILITECDADNTLSNKELWHQFSLKMTVITVPSRCTCFRYRQQFAGTLSPRSTRVTLMFSILWLHFLSYNAQFILLLLSQMCLVCKRLHHVRDPRSWPV
jgi:hypothetical protein